ncbi:hypothetical protein AB2J22_02115 [Aeromonas sp. A5]|uniref:hypothetical protein n=1 Tax=unclassified Aeromonas TaxID=257493 RepID=UPI0037703886
MWFDWQTLNTGILALISSLIALYSVKYRQLHLEEKEVQVAKVLLPDALVELNDYTKKAGRVLVHALEIKNSDQYRDNTGLGMELPSRPTSHMDVISTIIRNSNDEFTKSFSIFIKKMQIFNSRLCSLEESFRPSSSCITLNVNIFDNMILLAEIHSLIDLFFEYARDENLAKISPLIKRDSITNSFLALDIDLDNLPDLKKILDKRQPE